jgi:hypothetical protein
MQKLNVFGGVLSILVEVDRSKVWYIEEEKMCHSVPVGKATNGAPFVEF